MSSQSQYAEGQVWRGNEHWYVVGRVDRFDDLNVISISAFKDADLSDQFAGHLPVSEDSFRGWALELVGEGGTVGAHFEDGYGQWREAFDKGEAGVW